MKSEFRSNENTVMNNNKTFEDKVDKLPLLINFSSGNEIQEKQSTSAEVNSPSPFTTDEIMNDGIETAESTPETGNEKCKQLNNITSTLILGGKKLLNKKKIFKIYENHSQGKKKITTLQYNKQDLVNLKLLQLNEIELRTKEYQRINQKLLMKLAVLEAGNQELIHETSQSFLEIYGTKGI